MTLHLDPQLRDALERLAVATPLLVALDFDGSMAPLVDHPTDARPLPQSAELAHLLSHREGVITALISGRDLDSLRMVYPEPRPEVLVGSHGAERVVPAALGSAAQEIELTAAQSDSLRTVTEVLGRVSEHFAGTSLEYKPASTVLHVRQAEAEIGAQALAAAQHELQLLPGVKLLAGKAVLEASVLTATKGQALQWLRKITEASAVLFVGDDVTDEDGFRALESSDVGIKVGSGPSAASFRITGPEQLPAVLSFLLAAHETAMNPGL